MNAWGSFTVLLSHSDRPVDFDQCDLEALRTRYADPNRLANLPPLETLAPLATQRHQPAGLSVLHLKLYTDDADLTPLSTFDPPDTKVQHACLAGDRLVVCLEDALLVFDDLDAEHPPAALNQTNARRIDDPWFAGLHTVFASGADRCIVSASAPDAILEIDLASGRVETRTRLPESCYGHNYRLDANSDLRRHYVANDLQLAHLNCACPDSEGGVVISTLIQGDIGYLDHAGGYRVLSHGHIGCHSARTTADGETLYFADSCRGELVLLEPSGNERGRFAIDSRWLHDVQHIVGDVFAFCVADRNTFEIVDVVRGHTLLSQNFDTRGAAVQFVSIHSCQGKAPQ